MTTSHQYDLFEDPVITSLRGEFKEAFRKTQKSIFSRVGDCVKMLLELFHKNEELEQKYKDLSMAMIEALDRISQLERKKG